MQESKRPDFITAFMGCMDLPLFGGIWEWRRLQPYLVFGEKDKGTQNLLVRTTAVSGKKLQDNHKANTITTL